jgi:hypothetical protein
MGARLKAISPAEDDKNPHPVYSPDLLTSDSWFFGYAKEQLKDHLITDENDLEDKLTDIWKHVGRDVL